jgi:hypothetical protein
MKEAMNLALDALKELVAQNENRYWAIKHDHFAMQDARFAIARLREALAKQEQDMPKIGCANHDCEKCKEQGEPVAWMRQDGQRVTTASDRHNYPDYETRYSIPLYTTPQQRKPLTDEQIADTFCKAPHQTQQVAWFAAGVRYAEAAHGIKE